MGAPESLKLQLSISQRKKKKEGLISFSLDRVDRMYGKFESSCVRRV